MQTAALRRTGGADLHIHGANFEAAFCNTSTQPDFNTARAPHGRNRLGFYTSRRERGVNISAFARGDSADGLTGNHG